MTLVLFSVVFADDHGVKGWIDILSSGYSLVGNEAGFRVEDCQESNKLNKQLVHVQQDHNE